MRFLRTALTNPSPSEGSSICDIGSMIPELGVHWVSSLVLHLVPSMSANHVLYPESIKSKAKKDASAKNYSSEYVVRVDQR